MIRLLVWLAGTLGWLYAIWKYHYWHEMLAVAVVILAAMWIVGGAFAISRFSMLGRGGAADVPRAKMPFADAIAAAERARRERESAK